LIAIRFGGARRETLDEARPAEDVTGGRCK
jgi:hypothetical protein